MGCSSCAGLTRASIKSVTSRHEMDCPLKPGNDESNLYRSRRIAR